MKRKSDLASRKTLKQSLEDGTISISALKRNRSLSDVFQSDELGVILEKSAKVGAGVFGSVKALKDEQGDRVGVVKITPLDSCYLGNPRTSPFRGENVEPRMLSFLWEQFGQPALTPHLVAPIAIRPAIVKTGPGEYAKAFCMESATSCNVHEYMKRLNMSFDLQCRIIFFQVCYTLSVILKRFPTWRHGDLHPGNVMLHKAPPPVSNSYTMYTIHGKTFYLPDQYGIVTMISDFDYASIPGYGFDNYKVLEQEWFMPGLNINTRPDPTNDITHFINYARTTYHYKFSLPFSNQLIKLFGHINTKTQRHSMPGSKNMHTPMYLLCESGLFDEFLKVQNGNISARFYADAEQPTKITFPSWELWEHRCCPVILPRCPERARKLQELPSHQYFATQCRPLRAALDTEEAMDFDLQVCRTIHRCLMHPKIYEQKYGVTDQNHFDQVAMETWNLATSFIKQNKVPFRWWYAVFSCAFHESFIRAGIFEDDREYMSMEQWTNYWNKCGVIAYENLGFLHFAMQWSWIVHVIV